MPGTSLQISSGGRYFEWITDPSLSLRFEVRAGGKQAFSLQRRGSVNSTCLPASPSAGCRWRPVPKEISGPEAFSLEQNRPNPFNPATTIGYVLPSAARVRLTVYDVLGRVVGEPVNGFEGPGYHSVTWNAEGVSSGVYFYRLEASAGDGIPVAQVLTKKMFLLR